MWAKPLAGEATQCFLEELACSLYRDTGNCFVGQEIEGSDSGNWNSLHTLYDYWSAELWTLQLVSDIFSLCGDISIMVDQSKLLLCK